MHSPLRDLRKVFAMDRPLFSLRLLVLAGLVYAVLGGDSLCAQARSSPFARYPPGFIGVCEVSLSSHAIRSDELLTITCKVSKFMPVCHAYVGVAAEGDWEPVGIDRWDGILTEKDTVQLKFVVRLRTHPKKIYADRFSAGVAVTYMPFEGAPNGWNFFDDVTILDSKALNDSSLVHISHAQHEIQRRLDLFHDYFQTHPSPEGQPYSKAWIEEWTKFFLEHENNDTAALLSIPGIPQLPKEGAMQKEKEVRGKDRSSLNAPAGTTATTHWHCDGMKFNDEQGMRQSPRQGALSTIRVLRHLWTTLAIHYDICS
jgi:hypothetical protein